MILEQSRLALVAAALMVLLILPGCRSQGASGSSAGPTPASASPTSATASPTSASAGPTPAAQIGQRTKSTECQVNGALPDSACTPGAIFPSATKDQVCQSGYAKSVRDVPDKEKDQAYAEYGIPSHKPGEYEVDHLISLELGGSNDIANLWPEAAEPRPGYHEKDRVENYLHQQVCSGAMSLQEAQREIATNWLAVYDKMPKRQDAAESP